MAHYRRKRAVICVVELTRDLYNKERRTAAEEGEELPLEVQLIQKVKHKANQGFFLETDHGEVPIKPGEYIMAHSNGNISVISEKALKEAYELCDENGNSFEDLEEEKEEGGSDSDKDEDSQEEPSQE